jgi:hypothetical protein
MESAGRKIPAPISSLDLICGGSEMMQSQEVDPNIEEDDEECDCEVCQAERAAQAEEDDSVEQLAIDRISDTEWKVCDFEETDHPLTYILYVTPVQGNPYANMNFTLAECDLDNFNNEFEDYQVFKREIWSAEMYVGDSKRFEQVAEEICAMLYSVTISNPIELAYFFGGQVHHRNVNMPPVPGVH